MFHLNDTSNGYETIKPELQLIAATVQWNEAYLEQQKKIDLLIDMQDVEVSGDVEPQYTSISRLTPVLQVYVQRVPFDPVKKSSFRRKRPCLALQNGAVLSSDENHQLLNDSRYHP